MAKTPRPLHLRVVILPFVCLLLALGWIARAEDAKKVPNSACMECHSDQQLRTKKAGQWVSLLVNPQHLAHSPHKGLDCVDCHEGFDPDASPHRKDMQPVNCRNCHEDFGKTHAFHPRLADEKASLGKDNRCSECHGAHEIKALKHTGNPFRRGQQAESCGRCHETELKSFLGSAHHTKAGADNTGPTPSCLSCHGKALAGLKGKSALERKQLEVKLCESCHSAKNEVADRTALGVNFVRSFSASVHGKALLEGNAKAPGCIDCHGAHETRQSIESNSRVNQQQISATCGRCHEKSLAEFKTSVHAKALQKGVVEAPTCTSCHGDHNVQKVDAPDSPTHPRRLSEEVCGNCHASPRLAKKYGLDADRFATFADSFHGLATRGGSTQVVNCASCHGSHVVKSQRDPSSSINKKNLVQTCANCHPGASEGFAVGQVHASVKDLKKNPILYWIANVYVLLIVVVIGGMAVHNLLDFYRKARRKLQIQKGIIVEHHVQHRLYLRMTVHERLQHAVLVISFVLLVVTGFMLRYPEAWWVEAIQHLSRSAFQWRGIIHRIAGVVMLAGGVWHVCYLAFTKPGRKLFLELLPRWNDLSDPYKVLRYNLGLSDTKPFFGRFCYIEKAEYWALVWGTLLMGATGAILWFDNTSMGLITKLGFDIARVIHFYEAVLATLAIIVWHFYFVIFNPDVYPMNLSWLTGRMSEREMLEEHPAELLRIKTEEAEVLSAEPHPLKEPEKKPEEGKEPEQGK